MLQYRKAHRSLLLILAGGLLSAVATADVYKYVDEKGTVHYTDKPRTLPAERMGLQSRKTDEAAVAAARDAELKRMQEAAQGQDKNAAQKTEQTAAAELTAKDKAERCTKARERYDQYMNSQRLYRQGADGERTYLNDAELDAARSSAKASMDELCK